MTIRSLATAVCLGLFAVSPVFAQDTPSPDGAAVYFATLEDGATVSAPVKIIFGLSGMGVAPAGTERENTGHHHLLIDRPPLGEGEFGADEMMLGLPSDAHHMHFGGGQTEVSLDLAPGSHTLQLVLGDLGHVPHSPAVTSEVITITVE
ncbi:DUF4399 domain-containing protein [Roseisalinus antarcticus]|uniref:DUF4399 domain-containing protein n=1 Tax=Roseisalinus antarcticus TaxID=254357 RepID=A0A1Y5SAB0_9RHOB|nr:DUF4399 domain-containing protein [Roseisalinus antarcticus]SLN36124.1 hypothetical protein ROA7023_01307 [Roseisalinus antarcticus]